MLNKFCILIIISFPVVYAQSNFFLQPAFYFTYGDYSDKTNSQQYSFFTSLSWNNYDYVVLGYDRINISNHSRNYKWDYSQDNLSGGVHLWFSELNMKLKLDFLTMDGNYKDDYSDKPVIDNGYLVSPEILKGVYPFYYGAGYSYFKQEGNNNLQSHQLYLRTDYYPHYKILLNAILSSHLVSDGRKQSSLQISVFYFPIYELSIKGSFTIGERSIFYHPDLMVLYNQLETQTANYSIQLNYNFYKNFVMSFQYQRSNFTSYQINYFVLGIKSPIYF